MAVSVLGSRSGSASANSILFSYTCHSGTDRKLLVAVTIRATTPVISGVTYNGVSLSLGFSNIQGDVLTAFYLLDEAVFPSVGSHALSTSTSGTNPKMAVFLLEVGDAIQGQPQGNTDKSGDASPLDVSITPPTQGGLVFCWSGRSGASTIDTVMTGTEVYIEDDLAFDFSTFEGVYVLHNAAGRCEASVDISSSSNLVAGAVAIGTTVDPYPNNGLFFGAGF